jgi:hypothetical protein
VVNENLDETDNLPREETPEPLQDIPESNAEIELVMASSETTTIETYKKVLELSSEQLVCSYRPFALTSQILRVSSRCSLKPVFH